LENNNYYIWGKKNEDIIGGASKNLKNKLNLILSINDEKIIHHYITKESITHNNFIEFLGEMKEKFNEEELKNYLIILDNAKFHLNKEVIKYAIDNKMKFKTNVPYYSQFNALEFVFGAIKSKIYRLLIKNQRNLEKEIKRIIEDEKFLERVKKIYLKELKIYFKFYR
jgi:hypothetical protein